MLPCLSPGDEVLVHRSVARHIQVGDLIVADHPRQQGLRVLKRVEQVLPSGELSLVGLNSEESTDSRHFGPVSPDRVIGRVISRL